MQENARKHKKLENKHTETDATQKYTRYVQQEQPKIQQEKKSAHGNWKHKNLTQNECSKKESEKSEN